MKWIRVRVLPIALLCGWAGIALNVSGAQPGKVVAWGSYYNGSAFSPVSVPAQLTNVVSIAGGAGHSLALLPDGTVTAWGYNYYSQTNVPSGLDNVTAIAAGEHFSLALRADGTVLAWGQYYNGSGFVPVRVPDGLSNVVAISAGAGHGLALQAAGTVVAWGDNIYGQTNVPASVSNVIAIATGPYSSLALQGNGSVISWGQRYSDGGFVPFTVPSWLTNAVAIAIGASHCLALQTGGTVVAWGDNTYGQTNVPPDLTNAVAIAAGGSFSLALRADANVEAWGSSLNGQTNVPVSTTNVAQIAAGYYHGLAVVAAGPVVWSNAISILALSAGASASLSVSVATPGAIRAQWLLNGSPIAGATTTSLMVSNFDLAQAGAYSVELTNPSGATSVEIAVLRLTNSPVVEIDGVDVGGGSLSRVDGAQVTMTSTYDPGSSIYYTLDGSEPDFTAIRYLGPFSLTNSAVIRAIAYNVAYSAWTEAAPIHLQIWPTYPLTIVNPGGGIVSTFPLPYTADGRYLSNSLVTLTAAASLGWSFLAWAGDIVSTTNVVSIQIDQPTQVQAIFGTSLNLFTNGVGSIIADPPVGPYPFGSNVQLTALPAPGNYFFGWAGAASGSDNPLCLLATNGAGITALFGALKTNQVALTIWHSGNGAVSADPDTHVYTNGQTVTLTATPGTNSIFTGWSGYVTSSQNPLVLQLGASVQITANFLSQQQTNPPIIVQQPVSTTASVGSDVVLTVEVRGDPTFFYQWRLNGSPLADATESDLVLTNLTISDVGNYDVVIMGPGGSVTSVGALLALFGLQTAPGSLGLLPLLVMDGPPGSSYQLQFSDDPAAPGWQPLVSTLLPTGHYTYIDDAITNHTQRFYRALPQ